MKINFLTTDLSMGSGGAIYDKNFFEILVRVFPKTKLYNDQFFQRKYGKGTGLIHFNYYYKDSIKELLDCEYLIMNSRLYTRMLLFDIKRVKRKYPMTNLLVIHHHSNFMNHTGTMRYIHRFFEKRVLKAADELIIPNEFVMQQVRNDFGVEKIKFLPSSFVKKKYKISSMDSNLILFVGNVEYRKGIIYGLHAFKIINKRFPELEYHIAGNYNPSDRYYIQLKKYIEDNGLAKKVIFEGRVSDERLDWLYENAKLFLFPSLLEGYGWVMAEAMGRGVPVIAFDNSAMPFTVKDNVNGLLIRNKDENEMAKKVCELITEKPKMRVLQQGALETYRNLPNQEDLNRMTEEFIKSWG